MTKREEILQVVISNPNFKNICQSMTRQYADDLYQECCEEILTIPESRLPEISTMKYWFYRLALNIFSNRGKLGKVISRPGYDVPTFSEIERDHENLIRQCETFMLNLNEFENRIVLLYIKYRDMKKVQKATGVSYSALRAVKEKIKQARI